MDDTNPSDVTVFSGLLIQPSNAVSILSVAVQQQYGLLPSGIIGAQEFKYDDAVFQTSSELGNLQTLPFTPSFTAANMVPGQSVLVTSHASSPLNNGSAVVPVSTVTLEPQTINGTIASVSTSGSFQVYLVTLAPYDLFPALANQPEQDVLLTQPNTVAVYVDMNTLNADQSSLGVGSLLRFHGLVFNDGGTLRMDCAEIATGVAE